MTTSANAIKRQGKNHACGHAAWIKHVDVQSASINIEYNNDERKCSIKTLPHPCSSKPHLCGYGCGEDRCGISSWGIFLYYQ